MRPRIVGWESAICETRLMPVSRRTPKAARYVAIFNPIYEILHRPASILYILADSGLRLVNNGTIHFGFLRLLRAK